MNKKDDEDNKWIWPLTYIICATAIITLSYLDLTKSAQFGDSISGFASALAFLWLIAGFKQQSLELQLQRNELMLQREALTLQTEEFKDLNKYQSLEHIRTILLEAEKKLGEDPSTLLTKSLVTQPEYNNIFHSSNHSLVLKACEAYIKQYAPIQNYLADYSAALRVHMDANKIPYLTKENEKPSTFLISYIKHAKNIPYLSRNYILIEKTSEILFRFERVFDCVSLALMVATIKIFGKNYWKEDVLKENYNKLLAEIDGDKSAMPRIVREYFESVSK